MALSKNIQQKFLISCFLMTVVTLIGVENHVYYRQNMYCTNSCKKAIAKSCTMHGIWQVCIL